MYTLTCDCLFFFSIRGLGNELPRWLNVLGILIETRVCYWHLPELVFGTICASNLGTPVI